MSRTLTGVDLVSRAPAWVLDFSLVKGARHEGNPPAPGWYARAIAALGLWAMAGLSWDLYAHWHLPLDTFFSPPHAVIYSAGLAGVLLIGITSVRNMMVGYPLRRSVPVGYELAIVGCVLFPIGGVSDLIWHTVLGFERVLPVWSPSHLLIFTASALILSGPLRHAWRSRTTRLDYGVVVATAMFFLQLTFPLVYTNPFLDIWAIPPAQAGSTAAFVQELGTASILLQAAAFTGFQLFLLRRFVLPLGTVTILLVSDALFLYPVKWQLQPVVVALITGLLGDYAITLLRPSARRPLQFRLYAAGFPFVLYAVYFSTLWLTSGVWWLSHVWTGMLPGTAFLGWLLSYLVLPPSAETHADPMAARSP
jgi:hypothetical protein